MYHLKPSIAVASQVLNEGNKGIVYRHILNWCRHSHIRSPPSSSPSKEGGASIASEREDMRREVRSVLCASNFSSLSNEEQIKTVIQADLRLKYGRKEGDEKFLKLLDDKD